MENNYWYVGQKVSDQRIGEGIVVDIEFIGLYPIKVDFSDYFQTYTLDGKSDIDNKFSSLSQNPHVPLEYKKINKIFKKGEVVWCLLNEGYWYLGVYHGLEGKTHKVNQGYTDDGAVYFEYLTDEEIKKFIELKV